MGHTVVIVEHHLGMIYAADWLIEIGPEAAAAGGEVVYQGEVAGILKEKRSRTAPFLATLGS
jgi:excinuclease ABC subunit A